MILMKDGKNVNTNSGGDIMSKTIYNNNLSLDNSAYLQEYFGHSVGNTSLVSNYEVLIPNIIQQKYEIIENTEKIKVEVTIY